MSDNKMGGSSDLRVAENEKKEIETIIKAN